MEIDRLLAVARGDEPADRVLTGGRVVDVFNRKVVPADVAIAGDRIAGVGSGWNGRETVDLAGHYVAPGLIDAHVHIESAMVPPAEFSRVVVPRGVTTVIADPHEIANVLGVAGIRFMLDDARHGSLRVEFNASSCVPATHLATAGAELSAADLVALRDEGAVSGLAEVMNYPGVIAGDAEVLAKIRAFAGRSIDGHCPGLEGPALNAYVAAGIQTDHESTTAEEALRKIRLGMMILIREGTVARNLAALLPLVDAANERRFCFCTDDRHVTDLIEDGSVDHIVRASIEQGLDPLMALRLATLNPAEQFGLRDRGRIAPGALADLVVFDSLDDPRAEQVFVGGRLVARDGAMIDPARPNVYERMGDVRIDWESVELTIPATGRSVRAIGAVAESLVTQAIVAECRVEAGLAVSDPSSDLLKMAVIERHRGTGNVGLGFVRGLGLRSGAIASTVAHDHHNLICVGVDDASMIAAGRAVAETGGGLAVADAGVVQTTLPLPVAGLMSDRSHAEVADALNRVIAAARSLGSPLADPFMTLGFLALEVIPAWKLTDLGLVDVESQELLPLFV